MPKSSSFYTVMGTICAASTIVFTTVTLADSRTKERDPMLETYLLQLANLFEPDLPKLYKDGTTTLVKVEAQRDTFTYHYQLDTDWTGPLRDRDIAFTTKGNCNPDGGVRPVIDMGATIEHSYVNRNEEFIGRFFVRPSDCN